MLNFICPSSVSRIVSYALALFLVYSQYLVFRPSSVMFRSCPALFCSLHDTYVYLYVYERLYPKLAAEVDPWLTYQTRIYTLAIEADECLMCMQQVPYRTRIHMRTQTCEQRRRYTIREIRIQTPYNTKGKGGKKTEYKTIKKKSL
jgi:hypothetical protein